MPKRAKRPAGKPSKSIRSVKKSLLEKVAQVPQRRAKLKVRGTLERHLEAKLELKMASKCALAAQIGAQVQLDSPTWQHKSNLKPSLPWKFATNPPETPQNPGTSCQNIWIDMLIT